MTDEHDRRYASDLLDDLDFRDKHVLDVGFGDGWLIDAKWQDFSAMTAMDTSAEQVATAEARWAGTPVADKVTILHGDIATLSLPKELYDMVVFSHSF